MNKREETVLGFPRGRVPETLRRILYRELTNSQVNTIIVVIFSHLLVEEAMEDLIFRLFTFGMPRKRSKKSDEEMERKIWKNIIRTPFIRKLELIKPILYKGYPKVIETINTVRNDVIHARKKADRITFEDKPIWEEETLAKYFHACQGAYKELSDMCELVDGFKDRYKRWAKKLEKLGISLF